MNCVVLIGSEHEWNGKLYNDASVADLITVITTTNPIPSIPEVHHIYHSQKSLLLIPALSLCKKIIVFDGLQPSYKHRKADYDEYKRRMGDLVETDPGFANTQLVFCEEWAHLAGAIRKAMEYVTTPYVFIHQHDFVLIKDFDLNGLIATMEANENVQHVRLGLPYTNRHWLNWNPIALDEVVLGPSFVPLCRHFVWSDNDHVTRTEYYKDFVLPLCGHGPMENYLDTLLKNSLYKIGTSCHGAFGTYVYGGMNDGGYFSHSDGREQ